MDPVNITDKKEWSSIDIFVFSNGQQYSPPRKYHLRSEELQWWGATLSHLGRTQYGSGHSTIELYAINGLKINGPLELMNGAAYVAVEPPDTFTDTGYEQYLLKASRSWEKRLTQKINNPAAIPKTENKDLNLSDNNYETNIMIGKNVNDESVLSVKDITAKDITLSMKTQNDLAQKIPQRRSNGSTKYIQKKQLSIQKGTLQKTCADTDKVLPCPRKPSFKNNNYTNRKKLSMSSSLNPYKRNLNEQSICSSKPNLRKPVKDQVYENSSLKSDLIETEKLVCQSVPYNDKLNLNNKVCKENHEKFAESISTDVQPIISLFKNNDMDLISNTTDQENDHIMDKDDYKEPLDNVVVENEGNNNEKEAINHIVANKDGNKQIDKHSPKHLKERKERKSNEQSEFSDNEDHRINELKKEYTNIKACNHISDEYIAYMNKGNKLLLRFHIKVENCKTIFNKNDKDKIEENKTLYNLLETEKKSQVNIDFNLSGELLDPDFQQNPDDNKTMQSLLNKLYSENIFEEDSKNPKIIILQCSCQKSATVCKCRGDDAKYKLIEKENHMLFPSCQCDNRLSRTTNENLQDNDIDHSSEKDNVKLLHKTNGNNVKVLARKFEGINKIISKARNSIVLHNNNDKSVLNESCSQCAQETKPPYPPGSQTFIEVHKIVKEVEPIRERNNKTSNDSCDKATQTDWSEVLIEARRQEDNTYTFHLPPLYVLKQCKL